MSVTMRQMLEAGVHFGHQTRYWNPKMAPYIFGHRNKIHIINLEKTPSDVPGCAQVRAPAHRQQGAASCSSAPSARRARSCKEEAQRCRRAVRRSSLARRHAHQLQDRQAVDQAPEGHGAHGRRRLARAPVEEGSARHTSASCEKLERSLGGIKDMDGAARRAVRDRRRLPQGRGRPRRNKLGIPVIGVVDTNHSPDGIDYVIPGNDDSSRAIRLYARGMADAILEGRSQVGRGDGGAASRDEFVEVEEAEARQ